MNNVYMRMWFSFLNRLQPWHAGWQFASRNLVAALPLGMKCAQSISAMGLTASQLTHCAYPSVAYLALMYRDIARSAFSRAVLLLTLRKDHPANLLDHLGDYGVSE